MIDLYFVEGLFLTCSYEYVTDDPNPKSFLLFAVVAQYMIPLCLILYYYVGIIREISSKEAALARAQVKVLNLVGNSRLTYDQVT